MSLHRLVAALVASLAAGQAAAQCFMVFDRQQRLVYQSVEAPFDMSRPISEGLVQHFPGHHLVMTNSSANCVTVLPRAVGPGQGAVEGGQASASPALGLAAQETLSTRLARGEAEAALPSATPAGVRTTRDGLRLKAERRTPAARP